MKSKKIYIGTSGWDYKHWEKVFYPEDLNTKEWFNYYSKNFNSVEINNTFYNLPDKQIIKAWKNNAPKNSGISRYDLVTQNMFLSRGR